MRLTSRLPAPRLLATSGLVLALGLTLAPSTALARHGNGDVRVDGTCTGSSDSKLKLSKDNGRIEVEFEVDSNVNGQVWNVRLRHDGVLFFAGTRLTKAPSGSFELRKFTANQAGADKIAARAKNRVTGEVCTASASI